jgi:hypothetical protein
MPDFTINTFHKLLTTIKNHRYTFQTFAGFIKDPAQRVIILRHDVDARKMNSLKTAQLENELGITGTYYFRMVPQRFDEEVIKQIASLGHEIGYHYEDVSMEVALRRASCVVNRIKRRKTQDSRLTEEELLNAAIASFRENLERLRRVVPVETICMHGSPLSKYDNRILWEKYNYRDFGIIGEPYFDINFEEVLYLTDTGRRWDGEAVSIRDKAQGSGLRAQGKEQSKTKGLRDLEIEEQSDEIPQGGTEGQNDKKHHAPRTAYPVPVFRFHSTFDIIRAVKSGILPDKIMLTVHPQRWDNRTLPWIKELVWQNIKNLGKRFITSSMHNST